MTQASDSIYSLSSRREKYVLTFILCYSNFVVGTCVPFLNPLVLDFSYKFNTTVDQVSKVFTVIQISYLLSALLGAVLLNYLNRQLYSLFHLFILVIPFVTIPHASFSVFLSISSFIGLGIGGFDTAQIAWMIDAWRHESAPYILCQHFAYSLGTLVPPLIVEPFITDKSKNTSTTTTTDSPATNPDMYIPFLVVAGLVVTTILMHACLGLAYKKRIVNFNKNEPMRNVSEIAAPSIPQDTLRRKVFLVALASSIIGFYAALELCTSQFLPTFSHFSEVQFTESEGAHVLFGLQLGFCFSRLIGIFLVLKVAPHLLFTGNIVIILVSNIILLILGGSSPTWLWIGSVTIGVGMSTVYPALYAYIEKYIFVNTTVAGVITVAGGLVSSIYPLIVGNSVEKNPRILTYVNFVSIAVCTASFSTLFWTTRARDLKREAEQSAVSRRGETVYFDMIPTT